MQSIYLRSTHGGIGTSTFGFALARALAANYFVGRLADQGSLVAAGLGPASWPAEMWLSADPQLNTRAAQISQSLPAFDGLKIAAGSNPPADVADLAFNWSEKSLVVSEIDLAGSIDFWVAPNSQQGWQRLTHLFDESNCLAIAVLKTASRIPLTIWQTEFGSVPILEIKFQRRVFQSLDSGYGLSARAQFDQAARNFCKWQSGEVSPDA